jgi:hypothetical protein
VAARRPLARAGEPADAASRRRRLRRIAAAHGATPAQVGPSGSSPRPASTPPCSAPTRRSPSGVPTSGTR